MTTQKPPRIHIPKGWPSHVKSAVLHIISLAHFSITHARGWAANSGSERVRRSFEGVSKEFKEFRGRTTFCLGNPTTYYGFWAAKGDLDAF